MSCMAWATLRCMRQTHLTPTTHSLNHSSMHHPSHRSLTRHLFALACRYESLSLSAVATQPSSCLHSSTGTMSGPMTGSSSCSSCRARALRSWLLERHAPSTKWVQRAESCWGSGGDLRCCFWLCFCSEVSWLCRQKEGAYGTGQH
jgi:hypothetical protein